jgi:hypothetical protein
MESLRQHLDAPLYWAQPKTLSRNFDLVNGLGRLATLKFETAFGSLATATTASTTWSFKRTGFFKPIVTVRLVGQETNVALYRPRWTGSEGEIELSSHRYTFRTSNFWATQFEIRDSARRLLITYRAGVKTHSFGDLLKTQAEVTITDHGTNPADLELLILLGWYIIVLHNEDTSAAAAGAAAVS